MSEATVLVDDREGVRVLTLNRPERLNAWTYRMGAELRAALLAANADDAVGALVVTGAGRAFCAGADIEEVFAAQAAGAAPPFRAEAMTADWVPLVRRSKPLVAAINGAAIGVGLSQVLAMDYILCAEGAQLALRFVRMGVVPELASSRFAIQRAGFGAASELMLSGRTVEAGEALALGLVDRVVPAERLLDEAVAVARSMGANPRAALAETKALITANACESELEAVLAREFAALDRCYASAEHREAVAAFLERRTADFAAARAADRS